jgi:hypothetical protein
MLGKAEWFERRKYGGWGIRPKTWQGGVYLAVVLIPFIIFQSLPYWTTQTRIYVTLGWLAFLLFDVTHIMATLKRDEREFKIEAMSERNAAWVMMSVAVLGVLYQIITSALQQNVVVDWFLVVVLFGGLIAKSISNFVLERRSL